MCLSVKLSVSMIIRRESLWCLHTSLFSNVGRLRYLITGSAGKQTGTLIPARGSHFFGHANGKDMLLMGEVV